MRKCEDSEDHSGNGVDFRDRMSRIREKAVGSWMECMVREGEEQCTRHFRVLTD